MTDFRVTMKHGDLEDGEVRRRLAEAYQIVLEACRRGEAKAEIMVERGNDNNRTPSDKGGKVQEDGR